MSTNSNTQSWRQYLTVARADSREGVPHRLQNTRNGWQRERAKLRTTLNLKHLLQRAHYVLTRDTRRVSNTSKNARLKREML